MSDFWGEVSKRDIFHKKQDVKTTNLPFPCLTAHTICWSPLIPMLRTCLIYSCGMPWFFDRALPRGFANLYFETFILTSWVLLGYDCLPPRQARLITLKVVILSRHTTRISSLTKLNTNMHKCIPNGMSANYTLQASGWLWPFSKPMDVSVLGIGIRSRKYADTLLRACVYPDTPLRWPPYLRRYAIMPIAAYNSICRHADRCLYAETLLIAVVRPSLHVTFFTLFCRCADRV